MFLSIRLKTCLLICGLAIFISPALSHAQMPSASAQSSQILPTGMEWNKPLKAGDLVLPPRPKPRKRYVPKSQIVPPKLGALSPPLLSKAMTQNAAKDVAPPKLKVKAKSADSLMLLQGLKSMLNMSGQNTDVPKSNLVPKESQTTKVVTDLKPIPMSASELTARQAFVKGQEPKTLVAPGSKQKAKLEKSSDGLMDIIFPLNKKASTDAIATDITAEKETVKTESSTIVAPKATELMEAPKPLADSDMKVAEEPDFFDRISDPLTSIFGAPVAEDERADITKTSKKSDNKECESSVTSWTRGCADAGYPAHYVGEIIGETRIKCPQGDARDVWLSNSCAAPVASSPKTVQKTTKMKLEPEEIGLPNVPSAPLSLKKDVFVPAPDPNAVIDASCGESNGMAMAQEPTTGLCAYGKVTDVFGNGPWRWSCKGQNGGMTVSCAAPVTMTKDGQKVTLAKDSKAVITPSALLTENGECGESAGDGTLTKPLTNLCETGSPSAVNGSGPWTWACSGINGGHASACLAPKTTNGTCGQSHDRGIESRPVAELCQEGLASAVNGSGPWYWTCSGIHGGDAATCRAPMKTNAVCGAATTLGHRDAPEKELCHVGLASAVHGDGPWSWSCQGANGGASVACKGKPLSDGACGAAHGSQYVSAPEMALCKSGRASRVTGYGPYSWSCAGELGGITVSCTAAKGSLEEVASVVSCGAATETLILKRPTDGLCRAGDASDVQGNGPWRWSCADKAGHSIACSTLTKADGSCGKAQGEKTDAEPTFGLCEVGSPSAVQAKGKKWSWACDGVMGGKASSCFAPRVVVKGNEHVVKTLPKHEVAAQCGASAAQSFTKKPSAKLCHFGKASKVKGKGPWNWTCGDKRVKVSCVAEKLMNAKCGDVNGSIQRRAPTDKLCKTGRSTDVSGKGPWNWSCIGTGGGESVSCSANSQSQIHVDGTCGAAANAVMTTAPKSNLCDTGKTSKVYGEGPWTWTCSGANGGIATTCTTMKVVPKAPPPPGPMVNGVCGSSNGVPFVTQPRAGLCDAGVLSALSGNGPWNWSCLGDNGGMTVSCTAPLQPPAPIFGECGDAHGAPSLTKPRSSLCSSGISSAVSGKGPWNWSCSGTNGGGAVSCIAPLAGGMKRTMPQSSLTTPSIGIPHPTTGGLVTPYLKNGRLPALPAGTLSQLTASKNAPQNLSGGLMAPKASPAIPVDLQPITVQAPMLKLNPREGLVPVVKDADGKIVPGTELILDPETSTVYFDRGSDRLDDDGVVIAELLARILRHNPSARITLTAYSDTGGRISPRNARKLSLKRALSIRDYLAVKGVPNTRVDVKPRGANVPSGDMDRVDVKVNK